MSYVEKSNPNQYIDFVKLIRYSDDTHSINFPIKLDDLTELEQMNRTGLRQISFRINVFREDPLSSKVFLIRSSPFSSGKIINVLFTEFEIEDIDFGHYILIDHNSFLKKRYISEKNSFYSYSNTIFCTKCFEHFRSENLLNIHKEVCGKRTHKKVFPAEDQSIHFKNHEYNFKRIFTGYADFESILKKIPTQQTVLSVLCHRVKMGLKISVLTALPQPFKVIPQSVFHL